MTVFAGRFTFVLRNGSGQFLIRKSVPFSTENSSELRTVKEKSKDDEKKKRPPKLDPSYIAPLKRPTWFDKKLLIFTKMYEKEEDIPEFIHSKHDYRSTMDRFVVMINIAGIFFVFNFACLLIYITRRRTRTEGAMYEHQRAKFAYYESKVRENKDQSKEQ